MMLLSKFVFFFLFYIPFILVQLVSFLTPAEAGIVFDISSYNTIGGTTETEAEFNEIFIGSTDAFDRTIRYLRGQYTYTQNLTDDYKAQAIIEVKNVKTNKYENFPCVPQSPVSISEFYTRVDQRYLLPLAKNRSTEFSTENRITPLLAGTYELRPPNIPEDLCAESELDPGQEYTIYVVFFDPDGSRIGTWFGSFQTYWCDEE